MSYINHYEIEVQSPGGVWEHVGNYYPKYEWRITHPWWRLWQPRSVIVNNATAAALVARGYVSGTLARLHCQNRCDAFRVWEWHRGLFRRLTRQLAWTVP